ncbi:hypothetical protein Tcan_05815 [Toxocara canis]|uniref:Uncharacterized protein n=1 Tax=Toxocara canis TaxID=6265 RepID=A0A0B2ULT8_TOXCA|nr:hypothetical protein Tcan_05815 [Toxocara canis]
MTAGLDEASADSASDNEPGFNTCRSMTAKSWNDQQRENCLLDAMMRAMETFHIQNVNSSATNSPNPRQPSHSPIHFHTPRRPTEAMNTIREVVSSSPVS